MDPVPNSILPDAGGGDAESLARLREQRWLLRGVREAVDLTGRRLAGQAQPPLWRSPAQRAYDERLGDLTTDLQSARRALDDALWAVDAAIRAVKAAP